MEFKEGIQVMENPYAMTDKAENNQNQCNVNPENPNTGYPNNINATNENHNAESPNTENNSLKGPRKPVKWLFWGLITCLLTAALYVSVYPVFEKRAATENTHNLLEDSNVLSYLYQNSYLLYRDLYNKENHTALNYSELYLTTAEGKEWLFDSGIRNQIMNADFSEEYCTVEEWETSYQYIEGAFQAIDYLDEHFRVLESTFGQMNSLYDYVIRDNVTGEYVTNLPSPEVVVAEQFFYIEFLFDAYGNATLGGTKLQNSDSSALRKALTEVIRQLNLQNLIANNCDENVTGTNPYYTINMPKDCTVTFCISIADNEQLTQDGSQIFYFMYDSSGNELAVMNNYSPDQYALYNSGCMEVFLLFALLVFGIGLYVPALKEEKAWNRLKICRIPFELQILLLFFGIAICAEQFVVRLFPEPYVIRLLAVTAMLLPVWYVGVCLRSLRELGVREYFRQRSICYKIFPLCRRICSCGKHKLQNLYSAAAHFDVTKNAHKLIFKIVLINACVLFVIGSLWFGGFGIAVIYSVLLYFVLRKYVSDLQKKYGILLKSINKIAEGELNVEITEDLGVFEPFKPQIIRIQEGFRKAIDEETKSQRMKAELLTNVSHDLKTPLTAIITYVDLLKDEKLTEEQRKEYLDTLERKSLRLKVLIEELFEVSKANSGNITLNLMEIDIISLIKQVAFEMSDKLESAKLDVRLNLPNQKILSNLDGQKTYRIYENLFGNIAKYALPGTRVYVDAAVSEDEVTIILKNITAEEIQVNASELTERFVRGDSSRNTEGSGLGLAIAKSFTELQGGSLAIEVDGDLFKVSTCWKIIKNI